MEGSNSKERIHRELREQLAQALGIPAEFLVLPYDKTKDLAKRLGCSVSDVLPMSEDNDPFHVGKPAQSRDALCSDGGSPAPYRSKSHSGSRVAAILRTLLSRNTPLHASLSDAVVLGNRGDKKRGLGCICSGPFSRKLRVVLGPSLLSRYAAQYQPGSFLETMGSGKELLA